MRDRVTWYIPPTNNQGVSRRWHVWRPVDDSVWLINMMLQLSGVSTWSRGQWCQLEEAV